MESVELTVLNEDTRLMYDGDAPRCRICLGEENENFEEVDLGGFVHPCLCKGSSKFVHIECLNRWRCTGISTRAMTNCSVCGFEYRLKKKGNVAITIFGMVALRVFMICSAFFASALITGFFGRLPSFLELMGWSNDEITFTQHIILGLVVNLFLLGVASICHGLYSMCYPNTQDRVFRFEHGRERRRYHAAMPADPSFPVYHVYDDVSFLERCGTHLLLNSFSWRSARVRTSSNDDLGKFLLILVIIVGIVYGLYWLVVHVVGYIKLESRKQRYKIVQEWQVLNFNGADTDLDTETAL
eukprot:GILJ01003616.1.p1 GENE.GILJ01003616.1~~GILJ01003616.1.p1  ORF type:complete len:299 (-),score=24.81 GILJ01003616.1:104-1000(-)